MCYNIYYNLFKCITLYLNKMARIQDQIVASNSGAFDSENLCLASLQSSTCKANYYGHSDLDPYVEGPHCKFYENINKWLPTCTFKMNTLSGAENADKFEMDYKNDPATAEYLNVLKRFCESNPTHSACFNIIDLHYDVEFPGDSANCDSYTQDKCTSGRYGEYPTDPYVIAPPCSNMDGTYVPRCGLLTVPATNSEYANTIFTDFNNELNVDKLDFFLKSHCRDRVDPICSREYLVLNKSGNSETICLQTLDSECKSGVYGEGDTDPIIGPAGCYMDENNLWYSGCLAKSGVVTDIDKAKDFHRDFSFKSPNETAEIIKIACNQEGNRDLDECKKSVDPCVYSPWLTKCGGTGNECDYTPDAVKCNEPCLSSPWLTECGGTGNKCEYTPDSFDCQEPCLSSPWLTGCGGTGNKCDYEPDAIECTDHCLNNPWYPDCGGTGNPCDYKPDSDECKAHQCINTPWLLQCGGTGNKCEYTPQAIECNEPCISSPWLTFCGGTGNECDYKPDDVKCKEPCLTSPWLTECDGTGNKCDYKPDSPECDACFNNPGTQICCAMNPTHPSCVCFLFPGLDGCNAATVNRWATFTIAILFLFLVYRLIK